MMTRDSRPGRAPLPRGRNPRRGSAGPSGGAAGGWRAARRRPTGWRAACRDRRAAARAPPGRTDPARRRSRRSASRRPCSRGPGAGPRSRLSGGRQRLARLLGLAGLGLLRHVGGRRLGLLRRRPRSISSSPGLGVLDLHGLGFVLGLALAVLALVLLVVLRVARRCRPRRRDPPPLASCMPRWVRRSLTRRAKARWFSSTPSRRARSWRRLLLDPGPPQVDELARRRRRLEPGQLLAHQHRHARPRPARPRASGCPRSLSAAEVAVLQHGREVLGDARHAARADRLAARLLDCIEDAARLLGLRREAAVHGGVMAGEPQRHRIGLAAHDRRGRRHRACAAAPTDAPCRRSGPAARTRRRHFEVALPGDRPQARRRPSA